VALREIEEIVVIQDQQDPMVQLDLQGLLALLERGDHREDQDRLGKMVEREKPAHQDLLVLLVKEEILVTQEQQEVLGLLDHWDQQDPRDHRVLRETRDRKVKVDQEDLQDHLVVQV
jgi:hypothetical protein